MNTECGFFAVNGKHCIINDQCIVCKATEPPKLVKGETITLTNFGSLDGTYNITDIKNGTLKLEFLK